MDADTTNGGWAALVAEAVVGPMQRVGSGDATSGNVERLVAWDGLFPPGLSSSGLDGQYHSSDKYFPIKR